MACWSRWGSAPRPIGSVPSFPAASSSALRSRGPSPTSPQFLDVRNSNLVFDLLTRLAKENGQAVVLVTHNPEIAQRCDVTRPMRDGVFV